MMIRTCHNCEKKALADTKAYDEGPDRDPSWDPPAMLYYVGGYTECDYCGWDGGDRGTEFEEPFEPELDPSEPRYEY